MDIKISEVLSTEAMQVLQELTGDSTLSEIEQNLLPLFLRFDTVEFYFKNPIQDLFSTDKSYVLERVNSTCFVVSEYCENETLPNRSFIFPWGEIQATVFKVSKNFQQNKDTVSELFSTTTETESIKDVWFPGSLNEE